VSTFEQRTVRRYNNTNCTYGVNLQHEGFYFRIALCKEFFSRSHEDRTIFLQRIMAYQFDLASDIIDRKHSHLHGSNALSNEIQRGELIDHKIRSMNESKARRDLFIISDASSPSSSVGAPSGGTHKPLLGGQTFWCSRAPVQIIRAVFPRMNPCAIIP
jgi:hypothetical protein